MTRVPDAKTPKAPRRKAPRRKKEKPVEVILNRGIIASSKKIEQGGALVVFQNYKIKLDEFARRSLSEEEIPDVVERTREAFRRCRDRIEGDQNYHKEYRETHRLMWADLEKDILRYIAQEKVSAARAVELYLSGKRFKEMEESSDENMRNLYYATRSLLIDVLNEKENTIEDIRERVEAMGGPVVLFCRDVPDSAIGILGHPNVVAVVREEGGKRDHKTIVLRDHDKLGVVGVRDACSKVKDNSNVIIDGIGNRITVNPSRETLLKLKKRIAHFAKIADQLASERDLPAQTLDGARIYLNLNVEALPETKERFFELGYENVGLVRTENFLALTKDGYLRREAPDVQKQIKLYERLIASLFEAAGRRKPGMCFRTIDLDGDKSLPYLSLTEGMRQEIKERGFSMFLDPQNLQLYFLFRNQLEALLLARGRKSIMFPNVFKLSDFGRAMVVVDEILEKSPQSAARIKKETTFGIMVEHPGVVHDLSKFRANPEAIFDPDHNQRLGDLSFMSIGTNDLTKYILGESRTSPEYDELHPRVLAAIREAAEVGKNFGLDVSLCGDMGNDPLALPVLLGLGIRSISFSPDFVDIARAMIRNMTILECESLIMGLEGITTAEQIRQVIGSFINWRIEGPWKGLSPLKELILD